MTSKTRLLLAAGAVAGVAGASPALAGGTTAGTSITNNVTVNYQVGGVAQNAVTASNSFTVDRKVDLTIVETGNATTSVSPGQTVAVTTFAVTNTSNEVLDFALTAAQLTGGSAPHGGTDNFNVTGLAVYVDTNGNGVYNAGTDLAATYVDELGIDATRTVFVVAAVPLGQATGDKAAVSLTATAREGGTATSQGAAISQTSGANTSGKDTVFTDGAGTDDAARDGAFSARDDYTVAAASLTVAKTSTVISDPVNGATDPKMIPGAVVEYCIAVTNAAGGAAASNVAISDPLPSQTTYLASGPGSIGIMLGGTVTGGVCNADGASGGSFASNTVSGTLASVPAGSSSTLRFRVTVN
ncbi:DUF11 domain-containing protein [Sphingomonas gilva]|uniref:DUF11 domain-containing protein n=1 Tax=Sphingomonas gilva TaxID=2305907 RepID=A0A396RPZ5_9SPHN|nr:DUF11 domain-containing protein [Sphingomonas gilva]RHW16333.1 DUF11 domain-containing protein [Sphingomonas gilva]